MDSARLQVENPLENSLLPQMVDMTSASEALCLRLSTPLGPLGNDWPLSGAERIRRIVALYEDELQNHLSQCLPSGPAEHALRESASVVTSGILHDEKLGASEWGPSASLWRLKHRL